MRLRLVLSVIFIFYFISCTDDIEIEKKITEKADSIKLTSNYVLKTYSLDSIFFEVPTEKIKHITVFPDPIRNSVKDYIKSFIDPQFNSDTLPVQIISEFVGHKDMKDIYSAIKKIYTPSFRNELRKEIENALVKYLACFPGLSVPESILFVHSGFNYAFFHSGKNLLCGLDMYLGRNHVFYDYAGFPRYKSRLMDKNYLVMDVVKACRIIHSDTMIKKNNLLDHIIDKGKFYYVLHLCFPDAPDSMIMGYTSAQMDYLKKYEKKLWEHLTEKNKLFDNNLKTIHNYTSEGPFTPAISKECPPYIAYWFGYQIIKSFADKHNSIHPDSLMKITDSKKILFEAKYTP
jgi:hypothetical protein